MEQQLTVSEAVLYLLDCLTDAEAAQTQLALDRAAVDPSNPHTNKRIRARLLRENAIKTTRLATEAGFLIALTRAGRDTPPSLPATHLTDLITVLKLAGSFNTYMHWCKVYAELDTESPATTRDFRSASVGMPPAEELDLYPSPAEAIQQLAELRTQTEP